MIDSIGISRAHGTLLSNFFQRRDYAARRASIAFDKYISLSFKDDITCEKQQAVRWMRAWVAFAISYDKVVRGISLDAHWVAVDNADAIVYIRQHSA